MHAGYCRDGLTAVLQACPSISAVALRIHGESGIAEGSYEFWRTVFDGVARAGRTVEIDLHAKGLDQTMVQHAVEDRLINAGVHIRFVVGVFNGRRCAGFHDHGVLWEGSSLRSISSMYSAMAPGVVIHTSPLRHAAAICCSARRKWRSR